MNLFITSAMARILTPLFTPNGAAKYTNIQRYIKSSSFGDSSFSKHEASSLQLLLASMSVDELLSLILAMAIRMPTSTAMHQTSEKKRFDSKFGNYYKLRLRVHRVSNYGSFLQVRFTSSTSPMFTAYRKIGANQWDRHIWWLAHHESWQYQDWNWIIVKVPPFHDPPFPWRK